MAQPFDPDTRQLAGGAFPLAEHVSQEGSRYVGASVSENGTLVTAATAPSPSTAVDMARSHGPRARIGGRRAPYRQPRAVTRGTPRGGRRGHGRARENVDIWIIDIARNVRVAPDRRSGAHGSPVWSPDGTRVAFQSARSGKSSLREEWGERHELLSRSRSSRGGQHRGWPRASWSADGRFIAYTVRGTFPRDLRCLDPAAVRRSQAVSAGAHRLPRGEAVFSPDGRWIAYTTTEAASPTCSCSRSPRPARKFRCRRPVAATPIWRSDGKVLYYLGLDPP